MIRGLDCFAFYHLLGDGHGFLQRAPNPPLVLIMKVDSVGVVKSIENELLKYNAILYFLLGNPSIKEIRTSNSPDFVH